MIRWVRRSDLALLVWLPLVACGMLPCGNDGALAELVKVGSGVERDFAAHVTSWKAAEKGHRFHMGDGLRTPAGQTAELRLEPSGGMRVEPETVVRFQKTAPGETAPRLVVESGEILLETGSLNVAIDTGNGIALVSPGTKVRIGAARDLIELRVIVGELRLEGPDGEVVLGPGDNYTVRVGELLLESVELAVPADAGPPPAPPVQAVEGVVTPEADVAAEPTEADPFENPPLRLDVTIAAGEVATIHDPSPPTALAISVGCPGQALVEIGRNRRYRLGRVRLSDEARLTLPSGSYRYRVSCPGGAQTLGRVVIRRDAATRRLPRTPPKVTVDADGRPYTVRYQNLLPAIIFQWPHAPEAASYELRIIQDGKTSVHKGSSPRINLASGKIGDGTHHFSFSAAGQASKRGVLKVAFDNTARTAYLSRPLDGVAPAGSPTRVTGAALTGSKVSAFGTPIPTTRQGRFSVDVVPAAGHRSIAIRVQHPASGVHYYLRHLAE